MTRPEQFYHGSPNNDLEELEPRRKSFRKEGEGEVLFAGPDIACATQFLVRMYDDEAYKGFDDGTYFMVIGNRDKFNELDHGGTVYVLPDANFTNSEEDWDREWATNEKVKPLHKIHFDSALQAMIENGVKVYFTDMKTFEDKVKGKSCDCEYLEKEVGLTPEEQR